MPRAIRGGDSMDREKPRAAHTGASRAHGCWSACLRLLVASGAFGACSVACAQSDVAWARDLVAAARTFKSRELEGHVEGDDVNLWLKGGCTLM